MKKIKIYAAALLFMGVALTACKKDKSAELSSNLEEVVLDRTGWTATASSQEGANTAAMVLDGYTNTYWNSATGQAFPHSLIIDMKRQTVVTKIGLTTKQADPKGFTKFRLEGSNDGTTFTSFGEFTLNPVTYTEQSFTLSPARNVRFIKLVALEKAATQTGTITFLAEFSATGLQERKPLTDIALNKTGWTATASSQVNFPGDETNLAAHVVDVISAKSPTAPTVPSFWQADYDVLHPYPHWILIDMKTASPLTYVGLNAHTDPKQGFSKFSISGSTDGVSFTKLGDDRNFNATTTLEQKFAVSPTAPIRYVKITLLEGSNYPCLANFEAYVKL
ncbi:discoidin domain-containing protein [Pedobacter rhizosphaerae]|uniref:F5/8 type C domain-containing protein n=1 Tax=Pedobacter rhizosphaerae TaxID=390241 RepID=A0A1H9TPX9_9SPHI|nr:discoidin domain-containing protein [Pedobacter rhizosphaerae]SER99044.1 F5/8 type C domain-containing protein [Pedobacter rhizosphaerae]